jgi:hypothetical protein
MYQSTVDEFGSLHLAPEAYMPIPEALDRHH